MQRGAFSPDGKRFSSASFEELLLWDATGLLLNTVPGHSRLGQIVALSSDGTLASGGLGGSIVLWDVDTGQYLETISEHSPRVRSVAINADGSTLAIAIGSELLLRDVITGQVKKNLIENRSYGQRSGIGIDIGGGGLTGIILGSITLGFGFLDFGGGYIPRPSPDILSAAISGDGKMCSRLWDVANKLRLIDVDTDRVLHTLVGHTSIVWSVAFSPDGTLASGSADGTHSSVRFHYRTTQADARRAYE